MWPAWDDLDSEWWAEPWSDPEMSDTPCDGVPFELMDSSSHFTCHVTLRSVLGDPVASHFGFHLSSLTVVSSSSSCHQSVFGSDLRRRGQLRLFMSSTSTYSFSRTSYSSESGLPGESNTWNMILDLWTWNGTTATSGMGRFSMLLALVHRALVWPM